MRLCIQVLAYDNPEWFKYLYHRKMNAGSMSCPKNKRDYSCPEEI